MRRPTAKRWLPLLAIAPTVVLAQPAGATPPLAQSFDGTLQFCEPACELGTLSAEGPITGHLDVEIVDDRSNRNFTMTHAQARLTIDGDSVTLAVTLRASDEDASDPCRLRFNEDGRWRVISGTGRFADLRGEGDLHNEGVAIDHDPSCAGTPLTAIDWHLTGRVR